VRSEDERQGVGGRGSWVRVAGRGSRVAGRGSRIGGRGSRVEGRGGNLTLFQPCNQGHGEDLCLFRPVSHFLFPVSRFSSFLDSTSAKFLQVPQTGV
jgi:hypothetical protein